MTNRSPDKLFTRSPRAGAFAARPRCAFSLIELMIAVVILGFGMILAAAMFPVGWVRARQISDHTARVASVEAAHALMELTARVDGPTSNVATFAGDLVQIEGLNRVTSEVESFTFQFADTRVHPLNMENMTANGLNSVPDLLPDKRTPTGDVDDLYNFNGRIDVPFVNYGIADNDALLALIAGNPGSLNLYDTFFTPRVALDDRMYPPLDPEPKTFEFERESDYNAELERWRGRLDSRRYAWAALHRLRAITENVTDGRVFDMYYVTLRRTRPTFRYPRQLESTRPRLGNRAEVVVPRARGRSQDTILPTPWLVQMDLPKPDKLSSIFEPSGVPTEVRVPPRDARDDYPTWVQDLFQEGTYIIDEYNGLVFRVKRRRIDAQGNRQVAYLMLDQELFLEQFDDGASRGQTGSQLETILQSDELTRSVYVYPPVADRDADDIITGFSSKPPVIGIDVRALYVNPKLN